jgi:hypothetical protein
MDNEKVVVDAAILFLENGIYKNGKGEVVAKPDEAKAETKPDDSKSKSKIN